MAASARKRFSATHSTTVKNMLNSSGASTHPYLLRSCPTSNLSEHFPSSNRTHACMPSWNWRMTASILGGTPKRARTSHKRVRSTESYVLVRSIKHKYTGVSFFRASSCSRRTTNIMSTVERWGLNPHCSSGRMFSDSQQSLRRPAIYIYYVYLASGSTTLLLMRLTFNGLVCFCIMVHIHVPTVCIGIPGEKIRNQNTY